jgi:DNA polymerase-3 subunit epsilon
MFVVLLCLVVVVLAIIVARLQRSTTDANPVESVKPLPPTKAPVQAQTGALVPKQNALGPKPFRGWTWKTIAFMDVETTGLTAHDRVVTLAIILLNVPTVNEGETRVELTFEAIHRIYNPGRDCNPVASGIHGHSDWELRHQPFFVEEAKEVANLIGRVDLVVCHNAEFDLRFVNREFAKASMPPVAAQSFCTMEGYRRTHSGSASLNNVIRQLGLKREGGKHGALEDAWLAMNVFFLLQGATAGLPFSTFTEDQTKLQNLRDVPPMPEGHLPPRKRAPRHRSSENVA